MPLIDKNLRGKEVLPMAPHEALRYNERTVSERFNNRLKEEFGGKNVRVRGYEKVKLDLSEILLPLKPLTRGSIQGKVNGIMETE